MRLILKYFLIFHFLTRLTSQYYKVVAEVNKTFNFCMLMLKERKVDVVKELEKLYSTKQVSLSVFGQKVKESNDKIEQVVTFIEKWVQTASTKELLMFRLSSRWRCCCPSFRSLTWPAPSSSSSSQTSRYPLAFICSENME